MHNTVKLSIIMITGSCRGRAQKALNALFQQQGDIATEIILVDLGDSKTPFDIPAGIDYHYLARPAETTWGQARIDAVSIARGEIIAFIEDHCFAKPDWAENLVQAFDSDFAAVGYTIVNANPETYASRAGLISDYILWMDPVPDGKAELLPGNNVAYRGDLLRAVQERLATDLSVDFNIHEWLKGQGYELAMSATTLAEHQNYDQLGGLLHANFHYCRMLAANRKVSQSWSMGRQLAYIVGAPLGAPAIKLVRVLRSLKGRRQLWAPFVKALPVLFLTYGVSAIGETLGYLAGAGHSAQDFNMWEIHQQRTEHL